MKSRLEKKVAGQIANEIDKIQRLEKAAKDETESMSNRLYAVNELNKIIPNYNAQIDNTAKKYTASKEALDEYIKSLRTKYEIEANEAKIKDLIAERESLVADKSAIETERDADNSYAHRMAVSSAASLAPAMGTAGVNIPIGMSRDYDAEIRKYEAQIESIDERLGSITGRLQEIKSNVPLNINGSNGEDEEEEIDIDGEKQLSDKELKKLEKERKKAEAEKKKALRED